ncbi:MAG TPA: PEP-utilizing enzyme [Chloroflexota bacterium]|nr:PEP-utilizing enzyme [Chloroflexota bacterium]
MGATQAARGFVSPFAVEAPPGAEGWQRLYPYYYLFSEPRREFEEGKFWFFDGMHNPEPVYPFDTIMTESWWVALNQFGTRVYVIPPALGIDQRIVNGYLYISPNSITDPELIAKRAELFKRRAGHYYENWGEIYDNWIAKAEDCISRLRELEIRDLPEVEPEATVLSHRGLTSSYDLLATYNRLIENMQEMAYYHFEMLGLGYAAYLTFRDFCQTAFPGIADQAISKMVAGIDILFFRPDDEVRKLAALAIELELADLIVADHDPYAALAAISEAPQGERWLESFENAKEPWFWFSTGPGYSHEHRAWIDDLRLPFNAMRGYIEKLRAGEDISRPLEEIRVESERIFDEYRDLLGSGDREAFTAMRELARTVYPFVENHNFYVEHWHHSIFWNRVREFGQILENGGFLQDAEDIFFLHRFEIHDALYDLCTGWATGTPARGPSYWPDEVAERKRIMQVLREWSPPPALGVAPAEITEPFTVMLFGVTTETVKQWQGGDGRDPNQLGGIAASPGVAEGAARVITSVAQLDEVQAGEILICPITAPSWAPVFARIGAAVSDIGGIMSHAAIVSREYGLPAVVGTGFGTKRIRTGQRVRVDGDNGTVTIVD